MESGVFMLDCRAAVSYPDWVDGNSRVTSWPQ
jgi:hypothetical protein